MKVEYSNATKKKGAGIFVEITSASWIPKGYIVFAIAAEKKHYAMAINPF